jgi:hypothetical protein
MKDEKEELSIKTFPDYKSNPSKLEGLYRKSDFKDGKRIRVADIDTGVVSTLAPLDERTDYVVDERSYVKVYREGLFELGKLSPIGLKLLTYVMYKARMHKDEVTVDVQEFLDVFEYSENAKGEKSKKHYYKGIVELLSKQILFKKHREIFTFWINVDIFFNGKRQHVFNDREAEASQSPLVKPQNFKI